MDLYDKGQAQFGTLKVKPGDACRNYDPKKIAPVDWVALASLRDSDNRYMVMQRWRTKPLASLCRRAWPAGFAPPATPDYIKARNYSEAWFRTTMKSRGPGGSTAGPRRLPSHQLKYAGFHGQPVGYARPLDRTDQGHPSRYRRNARLPSRSLPGATIVESAILMGRQIWMTFSRITTGTFQRDDGILNTHVSDPN